MKSYKRLIFVTSLCVLSPVCAGLALWGRLPERVPTHFNFQGAADGWSGKPFAVFGLPLFLLAVHLACAFAVLHDPKRANVHGKILSLTLWISPAVSLFVASMVYPNALGVPVDVTFFAMLLTGILFAVVGNYLPKCRQNYTVGIKLPWTLADEDNWNRTHRMAGALWVAGGVALIVCAFAQIAPMWAFIGVVTLAGAAPVAYSALLYVRKGAADA
ncbi:MAG: SdpI family protein [Oscillibacter sp.]|nr:SdpI family protein [Oscillibacter sp.]